MTADNQFQLSVIQPDQTASLTRAARQAVPQFLQKLYEMVSNGSTNHLIRWSDAGDSFVVLDHERFARDVLPRWFKHNNFPSFVRQLNMYGFHKVPHLQQGVLKSESDTELWNFEHPSFRRNQPDMLCLITRKKQMQDRGNADTRDGTTNGTATAAAAAGIPPGTVVDINSILNNVAGIKRHQATISADLNGLKSANQALWQEAIAARERHKTQQEMINKILKFLAGVFGNGGNAHKGSPSDGSPQSVIPRRRQPLLIKSGEHQNKPSTSVENVTSGGSDGSGKVESSIFSVDTPTPSPSPSIVPVLTPSTMDTTPTPFSDVPFQFPNSTQPAEEYPFTQPSYPTAQSSSNINPSTSTQPSNIGASTSSLSSNMNMLTSSQQQSNSRQDQVLQSILNSPGQLQRLLNMMQIQSGIQIPQAPSGTNSGGGGPVENVDNPFAPFDDGGLSQRPISPFSLSADYPHSDAHNSSMLKNEDVVNFQPILDNTAQLAKSYKDSGAIAAHVDAMQASIDSLIHDLGLDPNTLPTFDTSHSGDDPVLSSLPTDATPHMNGVQTPPAPPPALLDDVDNSQSNGIPDFDVDAFFKELHKHHGVQNDEGVADFTDPVTSAPFLDPSALGTSHHSPGHFSAFVDEVMSSSDTSSPSGTHATLDEPMNFNSIDVDGSSATKKGRKRKSDADVSAGEKNGTKTKRKR